MTLCGPYEDVHDNSKIAHLGKEVQGNLGTRMRKYTNDYNSHVNSQ